MIKSTALPEIRKPKPFTGRIWGSTRKMAGPYSVWRKAFMLRASWNKRSWSKKIPKGLEAGWRHINGLALHGWNRIHGGGCGNSSVRQQL